MLDIDSPDIVVPRQSIAQGATPIAARESVIRHQMSMKEDDYTYTQILRLVFHNTFAFFFIFYLKMLSERFT